MSLAKVLASALAVMLILTCLTIKTVGMGPNPHVTPESIHWGEEPRAGAQRVVLMEEFTHWNCGQCTILKNYLEPAVENYTHSQVAPLYYHTSIAGNDPVFIYNGLENFERELYYGASTNPWTEVDGIYKKSFDPIPNGPTINGWFDERLAIPANITITTTGSLDVANLTGTVQARIEAVEPIAATDLIVQFALWEDHIDVVDRFGTTGSNGETEFRWTMWDMLPDAGGEAIWPSGADQWDSLDLTRNFTIEPEWLTNELGVTIWVQNLGTMVVDQAAVEDFGNFGDHPPSVDILTPGAVDQILPGSYDIIWTAGDYEDANSTLDVTVEYSPDGGTSWFTLESGIDNNDGIYTWDTTTLPDSPNYIIRVSATDSFIQTTVCTLRQPFSIDNIIDDQWFLQAQMAGSNLDLDMKPMDRQPNNIEVPVSAIGDILIDTWETTKTFTDTTINGDWTFEVNGYLRNNAFTGYLFAKLYTSTGPAILDTTIKDDENIGAFTSRHTFTWNDTLAGAITDGDSLIVELWLNITGGGGPTIEATANPNLNASSTGWTGHDWGAYTSLVDETWQPAGGNPGGWVDVQFTSDKFNTELGGYWEQAFIPSGAPTSATLSFDWICSQYASVTDVTFYVFIDSTPGLPTIGTEIWSQSVTGTTSWTSQGPIDVIGIVDSSTTYYLKIGAWVTGAGSTTDCQGGFDNIQITWETPFSNFILEFDYGSTQTSVTPSLGSTYAIGPLNIGWNFISTPLIPDNNSVPEVFTDLDGDTTWTRLQYYDAVDGQDHWKAWGESRPSSLNDLDEVNNTMGAWLFIPDALALGDGIIRVAGTEPTSTAVNLKAGWNMVGYPARNDSFYDVDDLIADTGATGVDGYNSGAPYGIDVLLGSYVLKRGEAYWIRVDSDTIWNVNW